MNTRIAAAVAAMFCAGSAHAQLAPIDRIKVSDNEMNCAQLYGEVGAMDKAIAESRAAESQAQTTSTAGSAANVAAKVAGQTGLFGQFGGLANALFGQAAAQTAAEVATQSGQQSAQQAAERIRQASARKEHVTTMFVSRGCKTTDLAYNPPVTPGAAPAQLALAVPAAPAGASTVGQSAAAVLAASAPITALPDIDPDRHFRGKMGGTFGKNVTEVLPATKRVMIAGFRVGFIVHNTVSAQVRASYMPGRDTSGARSTLRLDLAGVDAATMQALVDKAYADFLAQMKLAGRDVVPPEELKGLWSSLEAQAQPMKAEVNSQVVQFFSPRGVPLWFTGGDNQFSGTGVFEQANRNRVGEYSAKLNAIAVAPLIMVNFANMLSSGNTSGLTSRAAETGAELGMRVTAFSSLYQRADEFRNGIIMKGDDGGIDMAAPIVSTVQFGTMKETASSDNRAVVGAANILGAFAGLANAGGANRSTSNHLAETSNALYGAAATDALAKATGTFARWFQKYPAQPGR